MMMKRSSWLTWALLLTLTAPAAAGVLEEGCNFGARPAATLLVPYFEVELDDPGGLTTLLAVGNANQGPALARVVLWTDWGIPTLAFDVYLKKDDVETINLRDVFAGHLPETGGVGFSHCTIPLTNPAIGPAEQARLAQQHTGQPDGQNLCSGSGRAGAGIATGFLTIDALNRCSDAVRYPIDEGYFVQGGDGVAGNGNVLYGDFFYVDPGEDFAQGSEAVHIVADAERFGGAASTFYGRLPGATGLDERAPLGTRYRARYLNGGAFSGGTDLVVWAEPTQFHPEATLCGQRQNFVDVCQDLTFAPFDEDAVAAEPTLRAPVVEVAFKVAVGGPELPVAASFGLLDVRNRTVLGCLVTPAGEAPLQSWVLPLHKASGRFSLGLNAARTGDELCPPAPAPP
jgi:hypothetical protein